MNIESKFFFASAYSCETVQKPENIQLYYTFLNNILNVNYKKRILIIIKNECISPDLVKDILKRVKR